MKKDFKVLRFNDYFENFEKFIEIIKPIENYVELSYITRKENIIHLKEE